MIFCFIRPVAIWKRAGLKRINSREYVMQKHEFEALYGKSVSWERYQKIEAEYMESSCLDRHKFVSMLKTREAQERFRKQSEKASIEIQRHNITEKQFQSYIRRRLKGHPLEAWGGYLESNLGWGKDEYRTHTHDDGAEEIYCDKNGQFQTYCRDLQGNCYNFIYEHCPDGDDGKGFGYCYICDTNVRPQ